MIVHRIDKATERVVNTESWPEVPEETAEHAFVVQPGAGIGWSLVDGVLVPPPSPPPPPPTVPAKVHKVWLIRVLETLGLMDDLEDDMDAAWAAGNKAIKRYWQAANDIYRNDPILVAFAADRQWPPEQLDAWFIQAAGYEAAVTA